MRFLIKFATKNRPDKFEACIKNIHETISGEHEFKIEVTLDLNDYTTKKEWLHYPNISLRYDRSHSKIDACNRDMVAITKDYDWDVLINFSDDMLFVVNGWDKEIASIFNASGLDTFLHLNDGYLGEKLPTMSVMGREYYERFFYIYPPCYKSFSCDAEAMFVAQMLNKWVYYNGVLFRHEHPANNSSVANDPLYDLNQGHMPEDTAVYFKRLKKLFYVNNPVMIPELMKPYL